MRKSLFRFLSLYGITQRNCLLKGTRIPRCGLRIGLFAMYTALTSLLSSCSGGEQDPVFGAAYETTAVGIASNATEVVIKVVFTRPTTVKNTIVMGIRETGVIYGQDYDTTPAASDNQLTVTVPAGAEEASFTVTRLAEFIDASSKAVFTLKSVTGEIDPQITGNTMVTVSFDAITSPGAAIEADMGGPEEPKQVYVDLSLNTMTQVDRTAWDLGFYCGDKDKVILNYSLSAMAKPLDETDINAVTAQDTTGFAAVLGVTLPGSENLIDHPSRDLAQLAIADVSAAASENKVYILNMGSGPGGGRAGTPLGWKKIRILKDRDDYLLQYADIAATTHEEVRLPKDADYNFVYYSIRNKETVKVEPPKDKWDMVFTASSNLTNFGMGLTAYGFKDFVYTNRQGGVTAALVELEVENNDHAEIKSGQTVYKQFKASDLPSVGFSAEGNVIGSSWRKLDMQGVYYILNNKYYVVKDQEGNNYKVKFNKLTNDKDKRGHITFEYELLQPINRAGE